MAMIFKSFPAIAWASMAAVLVRLHFATVAALYGSWSGQVLVVVELCGVCLAAANWATRPKWDTSAGSWLMIAAYLAGWLLPPAGGGVWLLVPFALLRLWCLASLGLKYSAGGNNWAGLCDVGPYRFVRHPMLAAFLASQAVSLVLWPSLPRVGAYLVALVCAMVAVEFEEKFLRRFAEWRGYSRRVPCRFIPGVM